MALTRFVSLVVAGALCAVASATAQEVDPRATVDRFVQEGTGATAEIISACGSDAMLVELFSRDLTEQRTQELARLFWIDDQRTFCSSDLVDAWLNEELIERLEATGPRRPTCNIECDYHLTSAETSLWSAFSVRNSTGAFEQWLRVAEVAPSDGVRARAMVEGVRTLSLDERMVFFFENYQRPDLPSEYLNFETQALALMFIAQATPEDLLGLAEVPAIGFLIDAIRDLAVGRNRANPEQADHALAFLETALDQSAPGPRRDRLSHRVNWIYEARRTAGHN